MKIMTVLGTRPEIIRLSLMIKLLDQHADHVLVHTGQNYDDRLNGLFFRELSLRDPDVCLGIKSTGFGDQVGQILARIEQRIDSTGRTTIGHSGISHGSRQPLL
jgi:UDP-N-acetylglucosamine 2-epimerase (non-hydrolysing)